MSDNTGQEKANEMYRGIAVATIQFLQALGEDLNNQHFMDTPERVAKAWVEYFGRGYIQNPEEILTTTFSEEAYDQMVVVKDIHFTSFCAHHIVPFVGKAKIGYIPNKNVVGISKLARLLDSFANRLQIQERLTNQVAHCLFNKMEPKGVGVVIEAEHFCMSRRGVQKPGSITVTSCMLGAMKDSATTRQEFLNF